ncbi:P1 family peptidase [Lentzea flaviverrucosa]|uniref:L-aminopeptidase/D-esterase n=1 Tax=Lentzea flaviverrucosa TaxID=200379 RepID=A0A1H9VQQ1_9PSEU|nr:P1 family peptidase [Lentzea flaviverrucosa]RDI23703.1 L-aminopeptidase/D-esterase-like protein [Lentzea flaviverrucosa]SES23697.1 L-aminopeptidase/D-esterase [Lentzea flaviverrucosa]
MIPGVLVGHHHRVEPGWATGTTVVLVPAGAVGAVDSRGGAPGTRETDLLDPANLVQQVHAICLSGGSAYGLAAADGVMRWLSERSIGFRVGAQPHHVVPIVPGAVIFDLPMSEWGNRPDASFGHAACEAAAESFALGCVGAGAGARVGSLKGGVGAATATVGAHRIGALAVVNASGEVVDRTSGLPWLPSLGTTPVELPDAKPEGLNTTIGVVAVDADLSKAECQRLAMAAQDGLARAVRPAHSMFDGDTVFALATGAVPLAEPRAFALDALCTAAAEMFAEAVVSGTREATSLNGVSAFRDL